MKHVFSTDEIAHLWAHQTQDNARNQHGNFYFNGATIYSYGSHFPIATIVKNRQGETAYILTTDRYSNTTSKHIYEVRNSIPHGARTFYVSLSNKMVPYSGYKLENREYAAIIASYQHSIKSLSDEAIASRTSTKIQRLLNSAAAELANLNAFLAFFHLPALNPKARIPSRKLPSIPASIEAAKELGKAAKLEAAKLAKQAAELRRKQNMEAAKLWMSKEENADYAARWDGTIENAETLYKEYQVAKETKRDLERLQRWMDEHSDVAAQWNGALEQGKQLQKQWQIADTERRHAEAIAEWLRGEATSSWSLPHDIPTMLRIAGDNVETSHGASFPVAHAKRGLALVEAVLASGQPWQRNGHTCHLGHYQIDSIDADGTVRAGCHVVPYTAIARIKDAIIAYQPASESLIA